MGQYNRSPIQHFNENNTQFQIVQYKGRIFKNIFHGWNPWILMPTPDFVSFRGIQALLLVQEYKHKTVKRWNKYKEETHTE